MFSISVAGWPAAENGLAVILSRSRPWSVTMQWTRRLSKSMDPVGIGEPPRQSGVRTLQHPGSESEVALL